MSNPVAKRDDPVYVASHLIARPVPVWKCMPQVVSPQLLVVSPKHRRPEAHRERSYHAVLRRYLVCLLGSPYRGLNPIELGRTQQVSVQKPGSQAVRWTHGLHLGMDRVAHQHLDVTKGLE